MVRHRRGIPTPEDNRAKLKTDEISHTSTPEKATDEAQQSTTVGIGTRPERYKTSVHSTYRRWYRGLPHPWMSDRPLSLALALILTSLEANSVRFLLSSTDITQSFLLTHEMV